MELTRSAPAPETTDILDDLRRIVRALRESSRAAEAALGVTGAQLFVLKALSEGPAHSVNELAERTRTHQSTVSVVVKRLVEGQFVRRSTSESDARRVELSLTKRGRALLARAPFAAQERLIGGIEGLPVAQRKALATSLRQLVQGMDLSGDAPGMFFEDDDVPSERKARPDV